MPALTYAQLEETWIRGGGSRRMAPLMAAIALAESRGYPDATNPTDNNGTQTSWGLWQVSDGTHNPLPDWADPVGNARLAVAKLKSQGLGAWGTYTSGAYRQYLQGNIPPGTGGLPGGGAGDQSGGGGLFSLPSQVTTFFDDLGKLARAAMWLADPANWVRIVAGVLGFVFLGAGLIVMGKAA